MKLTSYETMDPHLLYGLVNTALRNDFEDLEDLVRTHDLDLDRLAARLKEAGYRYATNLNQFRPIPASER